MSLLMSVFLYMCVFRSLMHKATRPSVQCPSRKADLSVDLSIFTSVCVCTYSQPFLCAAVGIKQEQAA